MPEIDWRWMTDRVLYCVQFSPRLDDGDVDRVADLILAGRLGDEPVTVMVEMLDRAVRSTDTITSTGAPRHGEPEVRAFLRRLVTRVTAAL
jgi:hypothetical protein